MTTGWAIGLTSLVACVWALFGFAWWRMPTWARWITPVAFIAAQLILFAHFLFGVVPEQPWTLAVIAGAGVGGAAASARLPD